MKKIYLHIKKRMDLGIRNKVVLGFVIIGLMLSLSGVVAFFEFGRMSRYVSMLISENISSVNTTRNLINLSEGFNTKVLEEISVDSVTKIPNFTADDEFLANLDDLSTQMLTGEEKALVDSIRYSYISYIHILQDMEALWTEGYIERRDLYFNEMQNVYEKLRVYIQRLSQISQTALADNYMNLEDSFYRSIMPGIIAVSAGIVLVMLFYYFINRYILIPMVRMHKGLKNFLEYNKPYDVKFDYGNDQVQELNEIIKDLADENKSLKKK